jgi:glycosyltransferase involved in cell wall biosynthesis
MAHLPDLVAALRRQIWSGDLEILVVDSDSDDGSWEWVQAQPDIVGQRIRRSEFSHGRTRQQMALAARHEVVVVRVSDPLLRRGLAAGSMPVVDAEAGRRGVLRGAPRPREEQVPPGIDVVELTTDADYLPAVKTMLTERERRRAH